MPPRKPETINAIKNRVERKCSNCLEIKSRDKFNKDSSNADGLYPVCKTCRKSRCNDSYKRRKESILLKCKEYRKTDKGKEARRKEKISELLRSPEKVRSRQIYANAVKRGDLIRPDKCSICNNKGDIQGHHEDYSKPLDVIWCCHLCHNDIHNPHMGTITDIKLHTY